MHPRHPARPREREQRRPSWWRLTVTATPLGHSPGGRDLSLSLSTVVPGQVFTRGRQQIMCPVITGSLGAMPSKGPQSRSPLSFLVNQCDLFSPHFFFFFNKVRGTAAGAAVVRHVPYLYEHSRPFADVL